LAGGSGRALSAAARSGGGAVTACLGCLPSPDRCGRTTLYTLPRALRPSFLSRLRVAVAGIVAGRKPARTRGMAGSSRAAGAARHEFVRYGGRFRAGPGSRLRPRAQQFGGGYACQARGVVTQVGLVEIAAVRCCAS